VAHWTASAKWGAATALDGQCVTLLELRLNEGLGFTEINPRVNIESPKLLRQLFPVQRLTAQRLD
jgi:hypothetical protein